MESPVPSATLADSGASFKAALLKIASRCNLNCDYCYVYNHADQSWRNQPSFMAEGTIRRFAQQLDDYVGHEGIDRFSIIFHGGEPLLYGAERLRAAADLTRASIRPNCNLDFSLQTNGVLLTSSELSILTDAGIGVSLSLDGPRHSNDRHRLDHQGHSTFDKSLQALELLRASAPAVFSGVIAVIDPLVPPAELLDFFAPLNLPRIDFLLPDATHVAPPLGRAQKPQLYIQWLTEAFELWFTKYPSLPIRWFDAVLASCVGVPSPTDIMGFGAVSLLVVDTDGSYTDHDVFKITGSRNVQPMGSVNDTTIAEVARHPLIREHAALLAPDGIAQECRSCPVVASCAGGCVMHRAHANRGFDAPTVYCGEMFALLSAGTHAIRASLSPANRSDTTHSVPGVGKELVEECQAWHAESRARALAFLQTRGLSDDDSAPAAILLDSSRSRSSGDKPPSFVTEWLGTVRIHGDDPRLAIHFQDSIRVLSPDSNGVKHCVEALELMTACLRACDETLPAAIAALVTDVVLVESTLPDEGGIFSFSDDSAPDVVYIAPYAGKQLVAPEDLAESVYHEFLHHVLYHHERDGALLFDRLHPRFPAPWRAGMRPSGGFLHGTFVFTWLAHFWRRLAVAAIPGVNVSKAVANADRASRQAAYGVRSLRQFALATPKGMALVEALASQLEIAAEPMTAPGVLQ